MRNPPPGTSPASSKSSSSAASSSPACSTTCTSTRADDPDIPPPPEVLRDLVAKTIEPDVSRRKRDLYTATGLLLETSRTIERELFLVEPGAFDDLEPSDFEDGAFDDLEPATSSDSL